MSKREFKDVSGQRDSNYRSNAIADQSRSYIFPDTSSLDTSSSNQSNLGIDMSQYHFNSQPRMLNYDSPYSTSDAGFEQSKYTDNFRTVSPVLGSCSTTYSESYTQNMGSLSTSQSTDGMNYYLAVHGSSYLQESQAIPQGDYFSTSCSHPQYLQDTNSIYRDSLSSSSTHPQYLQDTNFINGDSFYSSSTHLQYLQDTNSINGDSFSSSSTHPQYLQDTNSINGDSFSSSSTHPQHLQDTYSINGNSFSSHQPISYHESVEFDTPLYMDNLDETLNFPDLADLNLEDNHANSLNLTKDDMSKYLTDIHSDGGLSIDCNLGMPSVYNPFMSNFATNAEKTTCTRKVNKSLNQPIPVPKECMEELIEKTPGAANRDRSPISWEFLMRLLVNGDTNPSIIRWENETAFVFKLVQPGAIVQIWAAKSDSSSNSKDNFARSLRFHYKKGVLIPVREKQYTYQCGPKAVEFVNKLRQMRRTY